MKQLRLFGSAFVTRVRTTVLLLAISLSGAALLTMSSCSKTDSTGVDPNFTSIYTNVLRNCASCHQPGGSGSLQGSNLNFSSQALAYSTLFGSVSGSDSATCGSLRYVAAGNASASYLVAVIDSAYNTSGFGGAGACQPLASHVTGGYASSAAQSAIVTWISNGAAND